MSSRSAPTNSIQAQVEQLTAEAKKLHMSGKDPQSLEVYRKASELMPGAPWLQHRTAELARKLKQHEVAAHHYRRAGAAFIGAGFPKRALAPWRAAWTLRVAALPQHAAEVVAISVELAALQKELGFGADAEFTIANADQALVAAGCAERASAPHPPSAEAEPKAERAGASTSPPESGVKANAGAEPANVSGAAHASAKP